MQAVGNGLVERLFLFRGSPFVPGDLDNHEFLGAVNTKIIGVEQEAFGVVLADDLEAVILRHADTDECLVDDTADFLSVGRVLTFAKIDTNEWHKLCFSKEESTQTSASSRRKLRVEWPG